MPKAVFSRSVEDLTENTFLETSEEALIYLSPAILGEQVARKAFSKNLNSNLKKEVAETGVNLLQKARTNVITKENNKKVIPVKAAIALAAAAIPLTEFSLNYIKNLITLKLFNKSDFRNIASLEKKEEDKTHQEKVKASAKKHIKGAASVYAGLLGLAGLLAIKGKSSKILQKISEFIVAPGNKLFPKHEKAKNIVNKYLNMDFNKSKSGKLVLSKGQLTTCVLVGGCGYFGASADRGKENLKETATRFPIVALYVITGSELVERGFRCMLNKMGKCHDVLNKKNEVVHFEKLGDLAEKLSREKGKSKEEIFKSLVKQKGIIFGLPYLFSLLVMGFLVAGLTVRATKKRYENELQYK